MLNELKSTGRILTFVTFSHELPLLPFCRTRDEALGFGDPRQIKQYMEEKGIRCWIDIEQIGKVSIIFSPRKAAKCK